MKRQNKPFVVEVKRQRRPDKLSFSEPTRTDGGKTDYFSSEADHANDFRIPTFLQTGQPQPSITVPVPQFFATAPKNESPIRDAAPEITADMIWGKPTSKPRILPSLIEAPAPEPEIEEAEAKPRRMRRKAETFVSHEASPSLPVEQADSQAMIFPHEEPAAKVFPLKSVLAAPSSKREGSPAASRKPRGIRPRDSHFNDKPLDVSPALPTREISASETPSAESVRKARPWRARRADASQLPPGQRWKRRLHPCAW